MQLVNPKDSSNTSFKILFEIVDFNSTTIMPTIVPKIIDNAMIKIGFGLDGRMVVLHVS